MKLSDLFDAFTEFEQPHDIRESAKLQSVLSRLPLRAEEYVVVTSDVLSDLTPEEYDAWTDEVETYQRFEDILRELLYADHRTAEALMWVVEWAARKPGLEGLGINPLAAFACELHFGPLPRHLENALVPLLRRCLRVELLAHNAEACLREIESHGSAGAV